MNVMKYRYDPPKNNPMRNLQLIKTKKQKDKDLDKLSPNGNSYAKLSKRKAPSMSRDQESCEFLGVTEDYETNDA